MVERGPKPKDDPLPDLFMPMSSTATPKIPTDRQNWISEFHIPGLSIIAHIDGRRGIVLAKNPEENLADNFNDIFNDLWKIAANQSLILSGSIFCLNVHAPQNAARIKARQTPEEQKQNNISTCIFFVNDVLYANGRDMIQWPLEKRKRVLDNIIPNRRGTIVATPHSEDDAALRRNAKQLRFKEISYRRKNGIYKPGVRSREWLRVKVKQ